MGPVLGRISVVPQSIENETQMSVCSIHSSTYQSAGIPGHAKGESAAATAAAAAVG